MILELLFSTLYIAHNSDTITNQSHNIDEVVVVSTSNIQGGKRSVKGKTASIDEHLQQLSGVSLIRRGSYAWEPSVNNMQTERVSTTIDGMKIFYACTDKMDPVTSYVESGNLQSISLNSGLFGNPQSTGNIGGSLDLKLQKAGFGKKPLQLSANAGYETNGNVRVAGVDAALSRHSFYTNFGAYWRDADNYKAGGKEVLYSQFTKINLFGNVGFRLKEKNIVEGTLIYDKATDVGYPALNMDVSKAEAFITSLSYRRLFGGDFLTSWETKAYYNHITHIMDDTTRPDVEIHMDMPGESWTAGLYSLLVAGNSVHDAQLNYDLYYNRLFADMTMYPGGAAPMYMVTWPDVGTLNTGLAFSDRITLSGKHALRLSAKIAFQTQKLNNEEGYKAQKVFFPKMTDEYRQTTGRVALGYSFTPKDWLLSVGAGWGSRAPTVTEAYGYYLNNTFDQFDYIGNPALKNESAVEVNASAKFSGIKRLSLQIDANAFFFSNYIIGHFENRLSAMTIGAKGVKVYGNLSDARIINTNFTAKWQILKELELNGSLGYALGTDDNGDNLPLVSPFSYAANVAYAKGGARVQFDVKGNGRQKNYAAKYGETETPEYVVLGLSGSYNFSLRKALLTVRAGVENLLDKRYSAFSDWCDIPQKGRNFYLNLAWSL